MVINLLLDGMILQVPGSFLKHLNHFAFRNKPSNVEKVDVKLAACFDAFSGILGCHARSAWCFNRRESRLLRLLIHDGKPAFQWY